MSNPPSACLIYMSQLLSLNVLVEVALTFAIVLPCILPKVANNLMCNYCFVSSMSKMLHLETLEALTDASFLCKVKQQEVHISLVTRTGIMKFNTLF